MKETLHKTAFVFFFRQVFPAKFISEIEVTLLCGKNTSDIRSLNYFNTQNW